MKKLSLLFVLSTFIYCAGIHAAAEPAGQRRQTPQEISIARIQAVFLNQKLQDPAFCEWFFSRPNSHLTQWKEPVSGCVRLGSFALINKWGTIYEPTHECQMFREVKPNADNTALVPAPNGKTIKENKRFLWKGFPLKEAPQKSIFDLGREFGQ